MSLMLALLVWAQVPGAGTAPPAPKAEPKPAPDAAAVKEAQKTVRETFKSDFALKSPDDRKALAEKLLKVGQQPEDDPAVRYAVLIEACGAAVDAGAPATALAALDQLSGVFKVDVLQLKGDALNDVTRAARTPEALKELALGYVEVTDQAVELDEFDKSLTFSTKAEAAAKRMQDPGLLEVIRERRNEIKALQTEYKSIKTALQKLDADPDDPAANLAVGRYFSLAKGKWQAGLWLLAKCSDASLRGLAEKEMEAPKEPAAQLALGDGWWEAGEKDRGSKLLKHGAHGRAVHWYEQAITKAAGLEKIKLQQRVESYYESGKGVTRFTFIPDKSMKPYPKGYSQGNFPVQKTEDATGPFRAEPVYFDQRTGKEVHYDVRSAFPVRQIYWKGAAMVQLTIEVIDPAGKLIATGGPWGGGNTPGEFTVDMPPRTRFILKIFNNVSTWLLIDKLELKR